MNRTLVFTLKMSVFIALFIIIFYAIDWRDSYSILNPEGEVILRVEGAILGEWKDKDVRFVPNKATTAEIIRGHLNCSGTTSIRNICCHRLTFHFL